MYDIRFNVCNNESISDIYRFIIIKGINIISDTCGSNLNICLEKGTYILFVMYKCRCYKYSFNVYKDYKYRIYIDNDYIVNITLTDKYYPGLPIKEGKVILCKYK